ncbi:hypothetical protein N658DRAFT_163450 [Parathielavia hyrcaniae]|uniref:Uncharacterized protein n=1 Tax=Parathielavia hyrcaniae TaxID=113614 RepID=A0AAN6PWU2_9PEZI|nr:hypothetical protein N658DRAFT_163450 [Parathielavia hyrcaniae]
MLTSHTVRWHSWCLVVVSVFVSVSILAASSVIGRLLLAREPLAKRHLPILPRQAEP